MTAHDQGAATSFWGPIRVWIPVVAFALGTDMLVGRTLWQRLTIYVAITAAYLGGRHAR